MYRGEEQKMKLMPAVRHGTVRKGITAATAVLFAVLLVLTPECSCNWRIVIP